MAIELYPHNKEAYEKAKKCIRETGKAAVVHPTGTGKSYIAFAFVEAHPNFNFLWLSPNDYIFSTQIGNLKKEQNIEFDNITFHTYAWLMWNEDKIDELKPDFIILDEFHRAGAREWGKSVRTLLETYRDARLLGLTATNVRYLDQQRDMAEEIFDGEVASYMSLAEAMAKRILPLPRYIISMYSYQEKIEHYKKRIKNMRNQYKKKESEALLEKLRRKLENAVGVEQIFAKHIQNKRGKYIVFCANAEHMYEMIAQVPLWFCYVDRSPHVYHVYSLNPETEKDFQSFLQDDSEHLKLLFCIDMLNEGIHVENVDGVILLRPTVSPIVYKQQIGRALAAGRKGTPLIFDMVNNFDSLFNIDALKEDIEEYVTMYGHGHNEFEIEQFEIIDELKECRKLFEQIQNNLDFSWESYYKELVKYQKINDSIKVSRQYVTESGLWLGKWLTQQRVLYRKQQLSESRIKKLEALGVEWEKENELRLDRWYQRLQVYYEQHGNVDVPTRYVTEDNHRLGAWCHKIRRIYQEGKLSDEWFEKLSALNFRWESHPDLWEEGYQHAKAYFEEFGDLKVIKRYKSEDGYNLGVWISTQRKVYHGKCKGILTKDKIKRLEEIGMLWKIILEDSTDKYIQSYLKYKDKDGVAGIPNSYVDEDGVELGKWANVQKRMYRKGKLSKEQIEKLEAVGFVWNNYDDWWMRKFKEAKAYYEEHGHLSIVAEYSNEHGTSLNRWLSSNKAEYDKDGHGKLSSKQVELLESIQISMRTRKDICWMKGYLALKQYVEDYGDTLVPSLYCTEKGFGLGDWVKNVKTKYKKHQLTKQQIAMLDEIHFDWGNLQKAVSEKHWNAYYERAKAYYEEHGDLCVPEKYVTEDGYALGYWVKLQRGVKKGTQKAGISYDSKRIKLMNDIGMVWNTQRIHSWDEYIAALVEFKTIHGHMCLPRTYMVGDMCVSNWVKLQRTLRNQGELSQDKMDTLDAIGFPWDYHLEEWKKAYIDAKAYYEEFGNMDIPKGYKGKGGTSLKLWWDRQRRNMKQKPESFSDEQIRLLLELGLD